MMSPVAEADAVYEVLSPLGEPAVEMVSLAPPAGYPRGENHWCAMEWGVQRGREFPHYREDAAGTVPHR